MLLTNKEMLIQSILDAAWVVAELEGNILEFKNYVPVGIQDLDEKALNRALRKLAQEAVFTKFGDILREKHGKLFPGISSGLKGDAL